MTVRIWILTLSILAWAAREGNAAQACRPSELSPKDAKALVLAAPEASYARRRGASLYVVSWAARNGDTAHFYFEELDQKNGNKTGSDSGPIGHFAVNRASGEVVAMDTSRNETGEQLRAIQRAVRKNHCIADALVKAERDRAVFPDASRTP